jgi:hypothetical protein
VASKAFLHTHPDFTSKVLPEGASVPIRSDPRGKCLPDVKACWHSRDAAHAAPVKVTPLRLYHNLIVGVIVRSVSMLISFFAVMMCRGRVLLGFFVSAVLVMMCRLPMVVRGGLMVTGCGMMMFGCCVSCRRGHRASPLACRPLK